jgi:hypothetical protein
MKRQDKYSWNWKRIAGTGIAAVALAILFCCLGGVPERGCGVRYETAWVAMEVLRQIVLACWRLAPAYLCENSARCEHLFQLAASVWPLFCVIAR